MATLEENKKQFEEFNKKVATEGITDNLGNILPLSTSVISPDSISGDISSVSLPTPTPMDFTPQIAQLQQMSTDLKEQQKLQAEQAADPLTQAREDYKRSISPKESQEDIYRSVYGDPISAEEYKAQQQNVTNLSAQLTNIIAGAQTASLQLESAATATGSTITMLNRQQQEISRQAAIKGLPIAAALQAAQGNLAAAQASLDRLFDVKTIDAKNRNDYNNRLAEVTFQFASDEQKTRLDASIRKENRDFLTQQANQSMAYNMANNILQFDPESAIKIASIDWTEPDAKQELLDLQLEIKTAPNNQIVQLENGNTIVVNKDTGKIVKNLGGAAPRGVDFDATISGIFGPLINTTANLEASVAGKKSVQAQLAMYIKNEDYESAYNQVANTVENSLPGTTRNRFANARIDREVLGGFLIALENYQKAGGDMGLLKGFAEDIDRKLGKVKDPQFTELAVQMQREFQIYRHAMTGAAFTKGESREYASVNPTSGKSLDLNITVIRGALNQLTNRIDGTIRAKVPQATDLLNIINIPKTAAQAKSQVNDIWQSNPQLHDTIESLFSTGQYDDFMVLEYLKFKNLIQ